MSATAAVLALAIIWPSSLNGESFYCKARSGVRTGLDSTGAGVLFPAVILTSKEARGLNYQIRFKTLGTSDFAVFSTLNSKPDKLGLAGQHAIVQRNLKIYEGEPETVSYHISPIHLKSCGLRNYSCQDSMSITYENGELRLFYVDDPFLNKISDYFIINWRCNLRKS